MKAAGPLCVSETGSAKAISNSGRKQILSVFCTISSYSDKIRYSKWPQKLVLFCKFHGSRALVMVICGICPFNQSFILLPVGIRDIEIMWLRKTN